MVLKNSGNTWLDQLWQWQSWLGTFVWGETRPSWLVLPSRVNWWGLNLGMVPAPQRGVSEHHSDSVVVILKVSEGKLRHLNGDSW